jgi:hypothetical protein
MVGAARHRAGIEGLAADGTTGNGPGAAGQVEGRGTSPPASSGARSASPGSPAMMLAPLATGSRGPRGQSRHRHYPWRAGPVARLGSRMAPPSSAASRAVRPGNSLLALAAGCNDRRMTTRRFPPPWRAEKMPGGYVVRDANGQALAYIYSRANEAEAMQAMALSEDEARRIAANIAKLPALLHRAE